MDELIKMPVIEERRVTLSGSSFVMTLPKEWVDENGIKEGDKILVKANGHLEIRAKNEENLKLMNQDILFLRNQLTNHIQMSSKATGTKKPAGS